MHLGDTPVITTDKPEQDLGIHPAGVFIDLAHDAEIERDDIAVLRDLQVSLMHVGMEIAVAQRVAQEERQHPFAQRGAVMARGVDPGKVIRGKPFGPVERHHVAPGRAPMHLRHAEARIACGVGGEFGG